MDFSVFHFVVILLFLFLISAVSQPGGGDCGYNSYRTLSSDQSPVCNCPDGYTLIDPNDNKSGCRPNFVPQSCDKERNESDLFYFVEIQNADWPYSDFEFYKPVSEEWCRQACLNDCFCAVAIFGDSSCWKKRFPLSNGRKDSSVERTALIKIRRDNSTPNSNGTANSNGPDLKRKKKSTPIITGSVL